jgi:hypothetical protein
VSCRGRRYRDLLFSDRRVTLGVLVNNIAAKPGEQGG